LRFPSAHAKGSATPTRRRDIAFLPELCQEPLVRVLTRVKRHKSTTTRSRTVVRMACPRSSSSSIGAEAIDMNQHGSQQHNRRERSPRVTAAFGSATCTRSRRGWRSCAISLDRSYCRPAPKFTSWPEVWASVVCAFDCQVPRDGLRFRPSGHIRTSFCWPSIRTPTLARRGAGSFTKPECKWNYALGNSVHLKRVLKV